MISPPVTKRPGPAASEAVDAATPLGQSSLTCRVIESTAEFLALGPLWRDVTDQAAKPSPALAWEWLEAWWDTLGAVCPKSGRAGRPYVVLLYEDLTPIAAYPFVWHERPWWSLGLRRLRPMGHSGELEPSGLTEEAFCVAAAGYEERARGTVIEQISRAVASGRWDCALVRQVEPDNADLVVGSPARRPARVVLSRGVVRSTKMKRGPQVVQLPGSWAEYRKRLSKSMRDNLAYYPRLMQRAGLEWKVEFHREPKDAAQAARDLVRLHRERVFSDVGHTHQDYFADAWQPRMLEDGMTRLASASGGFVATLVVDGQVAAAQSYMQSANELLVHYSGFDPKFAKFSPLLVLQGAVFRQAIEEAGIVKLNLLFGASPWQRRWGSEAEGREIRTLIVRLQLLSAARAACYVVARESLAFARRRGVRRWWQQPRHRTKSAHRSPDSPPLHGVEANS